MKIAHRHYNKTRLYLTCAYLVFSLGGIKLKVPKYHHVHVAID